MITEENINEAIKEGLKDEENTKIMHKASIKFQYILTYDEIESCQIRALWKALKNYDETKNVKFSTYLYNGVNLECRTLAKFNGNSRRYTPLYEIGKTIMPLIILNCLRK